MAQSKSVSEDADKNNKITPLETQTFEALGGNRYDVISMISSTMQG